MSDINAERQLELLKEDYDCLEECFERITHEVLGFDYENVYTYTDTYEAHLASTRDILKAYDDTLRDRDKWRITSLIFGGAFIVLSICVLVIGMF